MARCALAFTLMFLATAATALDSLSELPEDLVSVYGAADQEKMAAEPTLSREHEKYSSVPLKIRAVVYGKVEGASLELILLTSSANKQEGLYLYRGNESGIWYLRSGKIGERKVYFPAVGPGPSFESIWECLGETWRLGKEPDAEPSKEQLQDAMDRARRYVKSLEPRESALDPALRESLKDGHLVFDLPCCLVSKFGGKGEPSEMNYYAKKAKWFATVGDGLCVPVADDDLIAEREKLEAYVTETRDNKKLVRVRVKMLLGTYVTHGTMQQEVEALKILKILGPEAAANAPALGK
ncbi:MAG: hypothetical protein HY291_00325 [Planctomycetes bacterium]|nr:hypothetical protein [Planctomycetota bacterium]